MATALVMLSLSLAGWYVTQHLTGRPPHPSLMYGDSFLSPRYVLATLLWTPVDAGLATLIAVFLLALLRRIITRRWLVALAMTLLLVARMPYMVMTELAVVDLLFRVPQAALVAGCLIGPGALALFFMVLVLNLMAGVSLAPNFEAWWSAPTLLVYLTLLSLTAFGWITAVARPRQAS